MPGPAESSYSQLTDIPNWVHGAAPPRLPPKLPGWELVGPRRLKVDELPSELRMTVPPPSGVMVELLPSELRITVPPPKGVMVERLPSELRITVPPPRV